MVLAWLATGRGNEGWLRSRSVEFHSGRTEKGRAGIHHGTWRGHPVAGPSSRTITLPETHPPVVGASGNCFLFMYFRCGFLANKATGHHASCGFNEGGTAIAVTQTQLHGTVFPYRGAKAQHAGCPRPTDAAFQFRGSISCLHGRGSVGSTREKIIAHRHTDGGPGVAAITHTKGEDPAADGFPDIRIDACPCRGPEPPSGGFSEIDRPTHVRVRSPGYRKGLQERPTNRPAGAGVGTGSRREVCRHQQSPH